MRRRPRSSRLCLCLVPLAFLSMFPAHICAQYLYLDSNGDGLHTTADVFQAVGATAFDVWLVTDRNRDGSAAVCEQDSSAAFTINSYEVILHASSGAVTWGAYTNQVSQFSTFSLVEQDSTDLYALFVSGTILPPGTYRLGSVSATPLFGTPRIDARPRTRLRAIYGTSFGCQCLGNDQDNTMKLESDWFDADGLAYGGTNYPPLMAPTHDMLVSEGAQAEQELSAADPDGSPVTFEKVDGPGFVTVVTISSEPSAARGTVRVRPGFQDAGRYLVTIRATDESIENRATFQVEVQDVVRAARTVSFVVERAGRVRAHLFDVRGRLRRTLLDRDLPAGQHGLTIDRMDSSGRMLNAGVYFYRIQTPTRTFTGRVPVIKRRNAVTYPSEY